MRTIWRVWKGVGEVPCPICETRVAAQDLAEHLWSHKLVLPSMWYKSTHNTRAMKRSGLAPCCGLNFETPIEAARHMRELYDADKLDVHVVETATKKVFAPKTKILWAKELSDVERNILVLGDIVQNTAAIDIQNFADALAKFQVSKDLGGHRMQIDRTYQVSEAWLKRWARENHKPFADVDPMWHPVIRAECNRIDIEALNNAARLPRARKTRRTAPCIELSFSANDAATIRRALREERTRRRGQEKGAAKKGEAQNEARNEAREKGSSNRGKRKRARSPKV